MTSVFATAVTQSARARRRHVRPTAVPSQPPSHPGRRHGWFGRGWCGPGSMCQDFLEILVAAAAQADEDELLVELAGARERVCRLERGDDALAPREVAERGERLLVSCAHVVGATRIPEERMLGAHTRIVEAGR